MVKKELKRDCQKKTEIKKSRWRKKAETTNRKIKLFQKRKANELGHKS